VELVLELKTAAAALGLSDLDVAETDLAAEDYLTIYRAAETEILDHHVRGLAADMGMAGSSDDSLEEMAGGLLACSWVPG